MNEGDPEMVIVAPLKLPLTPSGKPLTSTPIAPDETPYVIGVIDAFASTICASDPAADDKTKVAGRITVMVKGFESAGLPVVHDAALEVRTQVTASPFAGV